MNYYCQRKKPVLHRPVESDQYTAIRYADRLAEAGALPSIGSVGDSYDNAMAESVIGLYKFECVRLDGPFRTVDDLGLGTRSWVYWFNHQRLHSAIRSATEPLSNPSRTTTVSTRPPRQPPERENPPSSEPGAVYGSWLSRPCCCWRQSG